MREHEDQALDRLLDAYTVPPPRPGLATRIVANLPAARPPWWPFAALWQPLGGLAAAALLGIVVGTSLPSPPPAAAADDGAPWAADWAEPSL
jgi:hypothetical protein